MVAEKSRVAAMTPDELRAWLDEEGMSVNELSDALDVHPITVRRWLGGQRTMTRLNVLAVRGVICEHKHKRRAGK